MAHVQLKNINKQYGKHRVVQDVNLDIKDGEFITLVGPSGCGKSTTLRMIAGLDEITAGELMIDSERYNDIPSKDRGIAMVFQSYALFPHMTVKENIVFGLKIKKVDKAEIERRFDWIIKLLNLEGLDDRKPRNLSGGQRQRVAVGRALIIEPKVLLLDEPLSNLDATLRSRMRTELKRLHKKIGGTTLYVTHDQTEAMTLSDRIVVMNKGEIIQTGNPDDVYNHPVDTFVANFIGNPHMNFFSGKIVEENNKIILDVPEFHLELPESVQEKLKVHTKEDVQIGIRPHHMRLKDKYSRRTTDSIISVTVDIIEPLGDQNIVVAAIGYTTFSFLTNPDDEIKPNDTIDVVVDGRKIQIFDKNTNKSLLI